MSKQEIFKGGELLAGEALDAWLDRGPDDLVMSVLESRHSAAKLAAEIESRQLLRHRVLGWGAIRVGLDASHGKPETIYTHRAVAVIDHDSLLFPAFQFNQAGELRPEVAVINRILEADTPSWNTAEWWAYPQAKGDVSTAPDQMILEIPLFSEVRDYALQTHAIDLQARL